MSTPARNPTSHPAPHPGAPPFATLVLMRHGESRWNAEDRFAGWVDVGLTERGQRQATAHGRRLAATGFRAGAVHTSLLARAASTARLAVEAAGWRVTIRSTWRLNERHYGSLQGRRRQDVRAEVGEEQVTQWRRSPLASPPPATPEDTLQRAVVDQHRGFGIRVPSSESLTELAERLRPYRDLALLPALRRHRHVLVVSHGNTLRALLEDLDPHHGVLPEIAPGASLRLRLDEDLRPLRSAAHLAGAIAAPPTPSGAPSRTDTPP